MFTTSSETNMMADSLAIRFTIVCICAITCVIYCSLFWNVIMLFGKMEPYPTTEKTILIWAGEKRLFVPDGSELFQLMCPKWKCEITRNR